MNLLGASQFLSFSLKVTAGILLLTGWKKYRRKSLLFWSFFFLTSSLSIVSEFLNINWGVPIFQAVGVSFLASGVVTLFDEEALGFPVRALRIVALSLPFLVSAYVVVYSMVSPISRPMYLSYGITGIFYTSAGIFLWAIRKFYPRSGTLLSAVITAHGYTRWTIHFFDLLNGLLR